MSYETFIIITWELFIFAWGLLALYDRFHYKDNVIHKKRSFWGGLYLTGGISIIFYKYDLGFINITTIPYIEWIGVFLVECGFIIALLSRLRLDGAWSVNSHVKKNCTIITKFPYSLVRHPIYSGQFIMCLGTSIAAKNYLIFIFLFIGTYIHHYFRVLREEKLLNDATNGKYLEKFGNINRFFPRIRIFK